MAATVARAIKYWLKAIIKPREVVEELKADPHKVLISFWITFLFAALYSLTAILLFLFQRPIKFPPWVPVAPENYYLYQTFWTIPWGLATWIMISGISHLLAIAGKKDFYNYKFEDALAVCAIGFVVPWTIFTWLPETFLAPFFGVFWPLWLDMVRVSVFPVIWQILLIAVGLRKTHNVFWFKGVAIGLLTVVVFFFMFLAFMR